MKKGEIWIISYPIKGKREQSGLRPGIILAENKLGLIATIPLSSNIQAKKFPETLEIKKSASNGLDKDSVALVFQVQSLDKRRFNSKIGVLEGEHIMEIDKILKNWLKLN